MGSFSRLFSKNEYINWAIEKTQLTFHFFKICFQNTKSTHTYFSHKVKFIGNNLQEYLLTTELATIAIEINLKD